VTHPFPSGAAVPDAGQVDLLVLDDWGPDRLSASQRRDLMEIVEDWPWRGSILITSQLPVATWHDVILDRIVHNAYRLELDGPSMRKLKAGEATHDQPCRLL
jgi:DNA replication protein DnaC